MPKKPLIVATSPLTNRIYAGHVLKDGQTWAADKDDVTGAACAAVAQHVIKNEDPVVVTSNGVPKYEITAKDLQENIPDRTHEECCECGISETEPPQCKGHAAGPTPCKALVQTDWVIHILGPDDVHPRADEITALREANALNKASWSQERHEHDPLVIALVKNRKTEAI
jgi:hypothetical protein